MSPSQTVSAPSTPKKASSINNNKSPSASSHKAKQSTPHASSSSSKSHEPSKSHSEDASSLSNPSKSPSKSNKTPRDAPNSSRPASSSTRSHLLHVQTFSQGRMSNLPIVFTRDADYFFSVSNTSIRIFSRMTGQVVSTLSTGPAAHVAPITSIMLNPANPLQLLTSSLDGRVKVWDFLDGILLRSFDLKLPVIAMTAHASLPDMVFVAVKKPRHSDVGHKTPSIDHILHALEHGAAFNTIITSFRLDPQANQDRPSKMPSFAKGQSLSPSTFRLAKTKDASDLAISPNGKWLVIMSKDKLRVANTKHLSDGFTRFISTHPGARQNPHQDQLTCMAFHPTDSTRIVTGDSTGRIRTWYCLQDKFMDPSNSHKELGVDKHAPSTTMHWHAHAVSSLAFSRNGAHLLSGGEEGVLVIWNLQSSAGTATSKEFVPRLGAPISSIAIANGLDGREQEYVLTLADGSISFISSMSLKPSRTFSRIKIDASRHLPGASLPSSVPVPLAVHPSTGNIVLLSGHPSSLQFYDPVKDTNTMELEVAPSNRVSRADEDQIEPTRVESVAFSSSVSSKTGEKGEWMVTFDSRNLSQDTSEAEVISESSLKFWRWNPTQRRYALNTRIDRPHHGKRLTSMSFSPTSSTLVTTSSDGKARIWHIASRTLKSGKQESYWACRSVFGYRDQTPTCSAFSADGSILAIGHTAAVSLWSPDTNLLSMVISAPDLGSGVDAVSFSGRHLAIATPSAVVFWDLILSRQVKSKALDRERKACLLLASPTSKSDAFSIVSTRRPSRDGSQDPWQSDSRIDETTVVETVALPSSGASPFSSSSSVEVRQIGSCQTSINAVVADPSSSASTSQEGSVHDFIAISQDMDLLQISSAASMRAKSASSTSAGSIRGISHVKKSLFDDLFGPSTFEEKNSDDPSLRNPASTEPASASGIASLFSTASHLLPPTASLFDDFLSRLLPASSPAVEIQNDAGHIRLSSPALATTNGRTEDRDPASSSVAAAERVDASSNSQKSIADILLTNTSDLVKLFKSQISLESAAPKPMLSVASNVATPTKSPKKPQVNGHSSSTPASTRQDTQIASPTPSKSSRKRKH